MSNAIEINGLYKSFGDVKAVQDVSFTVGQGELFAFLGLNGAGKSTTISIMCGQLKKDAGSVTVCGTDIEHGLDTVKSKIGVVFQNSVLDRSLSAYENLMCRAALYGLTGKRFSERYGQLENMLGFSEFAGRAVGKLSGGQRRRIDIARALIHSPEVLILDEPTTGLDPQTRKTVWEVIGRLRRQYNMTVFLTTHYMEEAADSDNIVILDSGKIAAQGSPLELKNRYTGDYVTLYGVTEEGVQILKKPYEAVPDGFKVSVENTAEVTRLIVGHPELFSDYEVIKGKMDDVFLAVTGKALKGSDGK